MNKKILMPLILALGIAAGSANADSILYDNGPINGTIDAWNINYGFSTANSFTVSSQSTISGVNFGDWVSPGDTPTQVEYLITTQAFGGSTLIDQTATLASTYVGTNAYGFDLYSSAFTISGLALSAGTYWLQLQNATTSQGNPMYWDSNNGPSVAYTSAYGNIAGYDGGSSSEAFQVTGTYAAPIPAAIWLVLSGLASVGVFVRRRAV